MSLKQNLINTKQKIVSIRDGLVQTLKEKNVEVDVESTLTDVANAVSNIKLGTETKDATASPDDVTEGEVFYNANGRQIGTMPDVGDIQPVDNIVTIPVGRVRSQQKITIPEANKPSVSQNVVTVNKGYVKQQTTVTVPEMTVTNDGKKVVVPVGYNKIEQEFNIEIVEELDTSDATATSNDVAEGAIFYGKNGREVGSLKDSIANKDDNVVTVPVGIVKKQQTLIIEESSGLTIDKNNILIEKGYIKEDIESTIDSGSVEISGDKVIIEEGYVSSETKNIKSGMVEIDEEQNKVIVSEGYLENQEINLPPKQETSDLILGMIDENLKFQKLSFNGQNAFNDGEPISINEYSSWNGTLPLPEGSGGSSAMDFYKCASVDTENKMWTGYKAVLADGAYSFATSATSGLTYGTGYTPIIGSIYDALVTIEAKRLVDGTPQDGIVLDMPLKENMVALTGQSVSQSGGVSFGTVDGINCMTLSGSGYLLADASKLPSGNAPWSLSLWMRNIGSFGSNGDAHAVAYGNGSPSQAVFVGLHNDGTIYTSIHSTVDLNSNENTIDSWHHTVVTFSGSTLQLWVDGVKCGEGEASATNIVPNTFKIGGHMSAGGFEFNGSIASVRMYDRVLTQEEIQLLASKLTPTV